ncbi:hypothetical protein [Mycobacterium simiae]|uniref:hypothetical protein n=1 Tax=Mycobacterium simiae TaxID=1784 RepID=UPI002603319B|nr:hypothetical protein [Mycobacterium simiae]
MNAIAEMPVEKLRQIMASFNSHPNKGRALEHFCAVFFSALPGVNVAHHNLFDDAHSQELDLLLENDQHPAGLDMLKPHIFVEAKNWRAPVGSAEVAWLDWKIRMGGSDVDGILVVANGVTGRPEESTSAWNILQWAHREQRRIFVLSPTEMLGCTTSEHVRQLIKRKKLRLVAGNAPLDASEVRNPLAPSIANP